MTTHKINIKDFEDHSKIISNVLASSTKDHKKLTVISDFIFNKIHFFVEDTTSDESMLFTDLESAIERYNEI